MNTMQQEFDAVVTHLFTQGRPAKAANGHECLYRAPGGLSCAVGCRIPDDKYKPEMDSDEDGDKDGTSVEQLVEFHGDDLPEEIVEYEGLFSRLQTVHDCAVTLGDGSFDKDRLAGALAKVAKEFRLTFTRPVQA